MSGGFLRDIKEETSARGGTFRDLAVFAAQLATPPEGTSESDLRSDID